MKNIVAASLALAAVLFAQPSFAADGDKKFEDAVLSLIAAPVVVTVETLDAGTKALDGVVTAGATGTVNTLKAGTAGVGGVLKATGDGSSEMITVSSRGLGNGLQTGGEVAGDVVKATGNVLGGIAKVVSGVGEELLK